MHRSSIARRRSPLAFFALIASALLAPCSAIAEAAEAQEATPGAALIESTRAKVTVGDYEAEMARLPPETRAQFTANRQRMVQMINALYLNRTIAQDARAAGFDRDPVVARQIELLVEKTLAQLWMARLDQEAGVKFDADPDKYLPRAREIYLTNPDKYRRPERIRVSHVLVKIGPEGEERAKARAEELRAKIAAGTPIATIARESSDDPSAKRNSGDLGFITRKDLDPDFSAAAFELNRAGELSPVVKSRFGYHVIELAEKQPAAQLSFDEVKRQILAEIRRTLIETGLLGFFVGQVMKSSPGADAAQVNQAVRDRLG